DEALMKQARAHGWRVNTWTVNDAAEVSRLAALGVNGLIGDLPEVLLTAR
ncbi:MAG: glycerophosphoryl diester phosphodiesterase, partial [Deinococcus sp.]|nr:glycerophosphoryl diester phosphodiesterase [Deinococcus sp.]